MASGRTRDAIKERQWRRWIEEWQASGRSVYDFCSQRRLSEPSFYYWRRVLAERDRAAPAASLFIPVEIESDVASKRIEIVLAGGQRLIVPPGFDAATLAQVVAVLEGRSC
jgi:transposase